MGPVAAMIVGLAAGLMAAGAALAATLWTAQPSPNPGALADDLDAVAATSPTNAWAVGHYDYNSGSENGAVSQTLIARWDGQKWNLQRGANPSSTGNQLDGVAATSPTNAWAVGYYINGSSGLKTLIEHWDGKQWAVQTSPSPATSGNDLYGVAATSPTNAWAVGYYSNSDSLSNPASHTLIEHWNGKQWKVQTSPNPGYAVLLGVAATSPTNAWAVGYYLNGRTLIERWNGKRWQIQTSPNPSASNNLYGVAATSPTNAWAVGKYSNGTDNQTLIEHWNGTKWQIQTSPNPGSSDNELHGVAATSPTNAWAVGRFSNGNDDETLIEHWNGKTWTPQPSPNPPSHSLYFLSGVAATSPKVSAWAVGFSQDYEDRTLIERWKAAG